MSRSIPLHPEHGVNPTITQCFLCGGDKNEIAMLGARYKEKAPMHMCIDKEPCDQCKKYMDMGVLLICVKDNSDEENPYRTGHIAVIKLEAAKNIFDNIGDNRAAFIEESAWNMLNLPKGNVDNTK